MSPTSTTKITIIVVPREKFSSTQASLESIYTNTNYPFHLIYIDAGSPPHIQKYLAQKYLEAQATINQFQLIRINHYLSPNQARNIGLQHNQSQYVIFLDNDVIVSPNWLTPLINCAETTEATIVTPLVCQGKTLHQEIHCAGGETGIHNGKIIDRIHKQGKKITEITPKLQRQKTGLAEFHCMLVDTKIFQKLGYLDEKLLNTKEYLDFCLLVTQAGGSIYLEPNSIVTYQTELPLNNLSDIHYYIFRWNDKWEYSSLKHLQKKWNLTQDNYNNLSPHKKPPHRQPRNQNPAKNPPHHPLLSSSLPPLFLLSSSSLRTSALPSAKLCVKKLINRETRNHLHPKKHP
jgi:glycosyltransferase involved in cell wall biosynthesis